MRRSSRQQLDAQRWIHHLQVPRESTLFSGPRGIGRLPVVRQKFLDAVGRVMLHACEHVGQVGHRVDAVLLARGDQRVEHREVVARLLAADEEKVGPSPSDTAQAGLRLVVVGWDGGWRKKQPRALRFRRRYLIALAVPELGSNLRRWRRAQSSSLAKRGRDSLWRSFKCSSEPTMPASLAWCSTR